MQGKLVTFKVFFCVLASAGFASMSLCGNGPVSQVECQKTPQQGKMGARFHLTDAESNKRIIRSIALGGIVGILHGALYAQVEKSIFGQVSLIGWLLAMATRNAIVRNTVIEAEKDGIRTSPYTVSLTAWTVDWILYLYLCQELFKRA